MLEASSCPSEPSAKTRSDLEWDRLLEALADRTQTSLGHAAALNLQLHGSRNAVLTALAEAREAVDLDNNAEPITLGTLPDAEDAAERARIGSALGAEDLRAVLAILTAARSLRTFLAARKTRVPLLAAACSTSPDLDPLERALDQTFEPDGSIADKASPALASLRRERKAVRDRLVRKLEDLIGKHTEALQDSYYTEREGRFVLPVRADSHEKVPGIVCGASASGATVFVEPQALVEQTNRLKIIDSGIDREERAIVAELSKKVSAHADLIIEALGALGHADLRAAVARLARDLSLTIPDICSETEALTISLRKARHPLLVLEGVDCVPSDIEVGQGQVIVISGPNAGGKTVALKTLGLACLMLRAGLPIPARDGSQMGLVTHVLTDVGDDQNLHKNLSTFSAHIQNLASILGESAPGALVLLDEVCGGTDPREGEALASAILQSLAQRGAAVACTTHYEGLKALALKDTRFKNASVGFDLATMSPTFRLVIGIPGPSSALAVAKRFGIPNLLIERAESFLTRDAIAFEEVAAQLDRERRELEEVRRKAENDAQIVREKKAEVEEELVRLKAKEKSALTEESRELFAAVKRARDELQKAQVKLRQNPTEADLRALTKTVDQVAHQVAIGGPLAAPVEASEHRAPVSTHALKPGSRVYVPKLQAEANVLEVLGDKVKVAAGALTLTLKIEETRAAQPNGGTSKSGGKTAGGGKMRTHSSGGVHKGSSFVLDAASDPDVPVQTSENTVDLRGLRAHEASSMAEQFLDRMLGSGRRVAFLIHGHGTGALREAVRDSVRQSSLVARSRAGEQREGGDGVTVVWLK
ncbi:MAG: endonuclease MutS2 [Polyangiaceae bacterium]|nr:endonuclease MutS2 [Polyangiaceae bacterium]